MNKKLVLLGNISSIHHKPNEKNNSSICKLIEFAWIIKHCSTLRSNCSRVHWENQVNPNFNVRLTQRFFKKKKKSDANSNWKDEKQYEILWKLQLLCRRHHMPLLFMRPFVFVYNFCYFLIVAAHNFLFHFFLNAAAPRKWTNQMIFWCIGVKYNLKTTQKCFLLW